MICWSLNSQLAGYLYYIFTGHDSHCGTYTSLHKEAPFTIFYSTSFSTVGSTTQPSLFLGCPLGGNLRLCECTKPTHNFSTVCLLY